MLTLSDNNIYEVELVGYKEILEPKEQFDAEKFEFFRTRQIEKDNLTIMEIPTIIEQNSKRVKVFIDRIALIQFNSPDISSFL